MSPLSDVVSFTIFIIELVKKVTIQRHLYKSELFYNNSNEYSNIKVKLWHNRSFRISVIIVGFASISYQFGFTSRRAPNLVSIKEAIKPTKD